MGDDAVSKSLPTSTEMEALEAPAELLEASANAVIDAHAFTGAMAPATDGDAIPADGELQVPKEQA